MPLCCLFPLLLALAACLPARAQYYIDPPEGEIPYLLDGVMIQDDAPRFEREPGFPGGRFELFRYLEAAIPLSGPLRTEAAVWGEALAVFPLDAAGRVGKVQILRINTPGLEFPLIRALENMPDWEPAVLDEVETAVLVFLPLGYQAGPVTLVFDESTQKAVMGRQPSAWWLKAVLLVGAVGLFAALFFGLR